MTPPICKLQVNEKNELVFDGPIIDKLDIEQQIQEDKRFGEMEPRNGEFFTYRAMDWQGKLISSKQVRKGVTQVWENIERHIDIDIRMERDPDKEVDFKIFFRSTADDPLLEKSTLQYHYYPIDDINNPLRGVCVVNTDFPITIHGEPLDLHELDPEHYPEPTGRTGITYDFDQIYEHEGPGHGLGLPHTVLSGKKMSTTYGQMAEHHEDEKPQNFIPRLVAKYGERKMLSRLKLRWLRWKRHRHDNY